MIFICLNQLGGSSLADARENGLASGMNYRFSFRELPSSNISHENHNRIHPNFSRNLPGYIRCRARESPHLRSCHGYEQRRSRSEQRCSLNNWQPTIAYPSPYCCSRRESELRQRVRHLCAIWFADNMEPAVSRYRDEQRCSWTKYCSSRPAAGDRHNHLSAQSHANRPLFYLAAAEHDSRR